MGVCGVSSKRPSAFRARREGGDWRPLLLRWPEPRRPWRNRMMMMTRRRRRNRMMTRRSRRRRRRMGGGGEGGGGAGKGNIAGGGEGRVAG
eukprot:4844374-Pyramimonas_sp.AAC.1